MFGFGSAKKRAAQAQAQADAERAAAERAAAERAAAERAAAARNKSPVLLLIREPGHVAQGINLIKNGPAPTEGGVIQFSYAFNPYDGTNNYYEDYDRDVRARDAARAARPYGPYEPPDLFDYNPYDYAHSRAAAQVGDSGNQAVISIASAIETSTVEGLHIRFAFCNLSVASIERLAQAIRVNKHLKGFSCFQNRSNFPHGKYDMASDDVIELAITESSAPIEIWNNNPIATMLEGRIKSRKAEQAAKQAELDGFLKSDIPIAVPETKAFQELRSLQVLDLRAEIDVSCGDANGKLVPADKVLHVREVAALSWRWEEMDALAMESRPEVVLKIARQMRVLGYNYVWIDWCCVPQFSRDVLADVVNNSDVYSVAPVVILSLTPGFDTKFEYPTRLWTNMELFRALTRPGGNMFTCCPDEVDEVKLCGLIKHVLVTTWKDEWPSKLSLCVGKLPPVLPVEDLVKRIQNPTASTHRITSLKDPVIKALLLFSMAKHRDEYQTALKKLILAGKLHCFAKVDYLRTVRTLIGRDSSKALAEQLQKLANESNAAFLTNLLIYVTDKALQRAQTFTILKSDFEIIRPLFDNIKLIALSAEDVTCVRAQVTDEDLVCRSVNDSFVFSGVNARTKWLALPTAVPMSECMTNFVGRKTKTGYQLVWNDSKMVEHIENMFM